MTSEPLNLPAVFAVEAVHHPRKVSAVFTGFNCMKMSGQCPG